MEPELSRRLYAEAFGTGWLVFAGCGSVVITANYPNLGIGYLGVALAFGLSVLTMAYAIGHVSGCHINPAVTLGLVAGNRFPSRDALPYMIAQVVGGIIGAGLLYLIASGKAGFNATSGFATNGYGLHSPGGYSLLACAVSEVVLTFAFVFMIMGATDRRVGLGFAPIAIGLGLTLIHLVGLPVTALGVNPARSTAPALFAGADALAQLWLFWIAPLVGGALGGFTYRTLFSEQYPVLHKTTAEEEEMAKRRATQAG